MNNRLIKPFFFLLLFNWYALHAQVLYEEVQPPALTNEDQYQEALQQQGHNYPYQKEENIDKFYQKEEKVDSLQDDQLQDDQ